MMLFMLLAKISTASAWWHEQWLYRRQIVFDTSSAGIDLRENPGPVVILLRLHSGNLDFSRVKEKGEDIRFVSSSDKTLLKHHFDSYEPVDEIALVWVQVPALSSGPDGNFIWMYYGNKAAEDSQDTKGTYDVNQVAVYHFGETEGQPRDWTAYNNPVSGFSGGLGLPAVIGNGVSFNGVSDMITIPQSPSLNFSNGFTFSTWIRINAPQQDAYLFSREEKDRSLVIGVNQSRVYCRLRADGQTSEVESNTDLPSGSWHNVAVSVDQNRKAVIYVDGTETGSGDFPSDLSELTGNLTLGGSANGGHFLAGDVDEVRISNIARPVASIRLAAVNQGEGSTFCSYTEEEKNEGQGFIAKLAEYGEYTKTVIRYTTLDGWAINITLLIILALSWIVLLVKTLTLFLVEKENRVFLESFRQNNDILALPEEDAGFPNSSLYQVYREGKRDLKERLGNQATHQKNKTLHPKELSSFKAKLEKGTTREEQKLNRWLLILTLAISGGPFLGLLGTVWGIMNTFAAMALAGEADIVVIAPGIASALSTTVLGLIVGIPALFGYNYLVGKIRNITADMYLFVDELTCKVDETYGEQ
ncbi:MAG: DUF2341 domain-containing protein [bacterium]